MPLVDRVEMLSWTTAPDGARSFGWLSVPVEVALQSRESKFRCLECHEMVRLHKSRKGVMASHPEHLKRNPSCSLSDPQR